LKAGGVIYFCAALSPAVLLTAGASINDILHQYVSTIKALRTIDSAGVFLEAVGEPVRDYLSGRRDTIKCIVTMLTDGTGGNSNASGNPEDSLLEELNRDEEFQENFGIDDDFNTDGRHAWINATRYIYILDFDLQFSPFFLIWSAARL